MDDIVGDPSRCVLAVEGPSGPLLSPMPCWSDGTALWMSTPAASAKVAALRRRPLCAVYVPPATSGERGSVVHGPARVYGPDDLLGLALHAPAVSAAMAALAVRNAPSLLGYVQEAARVPWHFSWRNRAALKIAVHRLHGVDLPEVGAGVAPALPTEIAPDVRRALAGTRRAVLALRRERDAHVGGSTGERQEGGDSGELVVGPVVLGPGLALTGLAALGVPAATTAPADPADSPAGTDAPAEPAALLLSAGSGGRRPTAAVGLVLCGRLRGDRLEPARATWWRGLETTTAAVSPRPVGGIVLPD